VSNIGAMIIALILVVLLVTNTFAVWNVYVVVAASSVLLGSSAILVGSSQNIWQTKVDPQLMGRAMALKNTIIFGLQFAGFVPGGPGRRRDFPAPGRPRSRPLPCRSDAGRQWPWPGIRPPADGYGQPNRAPGGGCLYVSASAPRRGRTAGHGSRPGGRRRRSSRDPSVTPSRRREFGHRHPPRRPAKPRGGGRHASGVRGFERWLTTEGSAANPR